MIDLNQYKEEAVLIRRYLHEYPELSHQEFETSEYLKDYISQFGLAIEEVGQTSFIAVLDTGRSGKTLGLRTDIDGLPISENPRNISSQRVAVSKNEGIMHACGHDMHMAVLLTSMRYLVDQQDKIDGKIVFIFEEAEEIAGGIDMMVDYLTKFDFDAIYGNHAYSALESGKIIVNDGPTMSGVTFVDLIVHGKSGHGSRPDLAISPIYAASQILNAWAAAWVNQINMQQIMTLGIGEFHSGTAANIIPSTAHITGTVRFLDSEAAAKAIDILKEVANYTALASQCRVTFHESMGDLYNGPVVNDEELAHKVQDVVRRLFSEESLVADQTWFASETFTHYQKLCPTIFTLVGIKNEEVGSGAEHHNELFDVDEEALPYAYGTMTQFALEFLSEA